MTASLPPHFEEEASFHSPKSIMNDGISEYPSLLTDLGQSTGVPRTVRGAQASSTRKADASPRESAARSLLFVRSRSIHRRGDWLCGTLRYGLALVLAFLAGVAVARRTRGNELLERDAELAALEERRRRRFFGRSKRHERRRSRAVQPRPRPLRPTALAERVDELDQKVRILERQLEIEREQSQGAIVPATRSSEPGREGLSIPIGRRELPPAGPRLPAGRRHLRRDRGHRRRHEHVPDAPRPAGVRSHDVQALRLQGHARLRFGHDGAPGRISRRAFLPLVQLAGGEVQVAIRPRAAGFARRTSCSSSAGLPTGLVPNRDVGLDAPWGSREIPPQLSGRRLQWSRRRRKRGPGQRRRQGLRRTRDAPSLPAARQSDRWQSFGVGLAASVGTQEGTLAAPNLPNLRRQSRPSYFRYRGRRDGRRHHAWRTARAAESRRRATSTLGQLGLLWEYVWTLQDVRRADDTAAVESRSWQVAGSWVLTRRDSVLSKRRATANLRSERGQRGGLSRSRRAPDAPPIGDEAFPVFANPRYVGSRDLDVDRGLQLVSEPQLQGGASTTRRPASTEESRQAIVPSSATC